MTTQLGKLVREERKELGWTLGEFAKKMNMSVPYLSQIETGSKPVQDGFVDKAIRILGVCADDANKLRRAAALSMSEFSIRMKNGASGNDRILASELATGFARMSPETKEKLRALMKENSDG